MVAPAQRPLSYNEWQMQQYGNVAPVTPTAPAWTPPPEQAAPTPTPTAAAPPPEYGPPNYVPGSTYTPYVVPAEPIYETPAPNPTYGGMTEAEASAAYAQNVPSWSVPFAQTSALENYQAEQQQFADETQRQYAVAQLPAKIEELRRYDQVSGEGIYQPTIGRPLRDVEHQTGASLFAYEQDLSRRAMDQLLHPEQQGWEATVVAPAGRAKEAVGGLLPDQLDAVAGALSAAGGAITDRLGASKEANQQLVEQQAQPVSGMPGVGDIAGSTVRGGWEGLTAEQDILRKPAALLTGVVQGANQPLSQVTEVVGTRAYDRAVKGDERATFDDDLMTSFYEDLVGAGFSPIAFGRFANDPKNKDIIQRTFEQGYRGYTKGQAVYQFYRDQQGLGGVVTDIAYDPLVPAEIALAVSTMGLGGLAAAGGKAAGKEAAGMALRNVVTGAGRVARAVAFDPLDVPTVARDAAGIVAPDLMARAGEKATDIYRRHVLTESGRRDVVSTEIGVAAQRAAESARQRVAAPPAPWLFERDAAGRVRLQTGPGDTVRPLVRDPISGIVRQITEADVDMATRIMAQLPRAQFDRMERDWFGLAMNPAHLRAAGMGRTVEKLYPRHGPEYERYVGMMAMRVRTRGQEVIDALYQEARRDHAPAIADLARVKRTAPRGRAATPAALAAHRTALRSAQNRVTRAAYQAAMIDAATAIAGVADNKAALHGRWAKEWRKTARTLPGYGAGVDRAALLASGASVLDPATGALNPGRRILWQDLTSLDGDTISLGEQTLSTGESVGQLALDVHADLVRMRDLANQAATGLSRFDQDELTQLLVKYRHLFPADGGTAVFNPRNPGMALRATELARTWSDDQLVQRSGIEVQERFAMDKGWLTAKRTPTESGTDWADKTGPLGARLSGAVRALDAVSRGTSKWLLHNPVRAPGFASLQLVGNAASQIVAKPDALFQYLRPAQWVKGFQKLQGDEGAATNYNRFAQASGMRPNPRVQNAFDPQRYGKGPTDGVFSGYFTAAKHAAGTFDLANAESSFMATVLKAEKRLQQWMHLPSGHALDGFTTAQRNTPIGTARVMGVPASRVSDQAIVDALAAARRGKPWGVLSAEEVRTALYDAAGVRRGVDPTIDTWVTRVGSDYSNVRKQIEDAGLAEKDRIAFSWNQTKADAVLGRLFLFHYWNTRASALYARNLLGNPAMLNAYVSLFRTLQQEAESGDYPAWLRGFARFMQTPAGIGVFLNPAATFNTMLTFAGEAMREDEDWFKRLTPLGQARENSPMMVHPVWDNLLFFSGLAGADARPSQLLPTAALNREIYNLLNLANIKLGGAILGKTSDGNPTLIDPRLRNVAGGEMTRALAEWFQTKALALEDPVRAADPGRSTDADIYYLMVQQQIDKGLTLEEAQQAVYEIGGQFNPDSPEYQAAIEQLAEAPFLGPTGGIPPESPIGRVIGALATRIGPYTAQTSVTSRGQVTETVGRYFEMQDAAPTYEAIVDGQTLEPIRVGGYRLQIPGSFAATEAGGTVYTPDEIAALSPEQRQALADQWLTSTLGVTEAILPSAEFPETELGVMRDAAAADVADLTLQRADTKYWEAGTPEQNAAADFSRRIAKGELESGESVTVTIDGQLNTFDQADLSRMTEDERNQLRWLWVNESGNAENVEGFYAAQKALVEAEPDLGGHQAMKDLALNFPGGSVAWVKAAIKDNPGYAEYARRLDPARYPPGSEDWAKEMLGLEAYQTLVQERSAASSPLAWENVPGAPTVPGLTGAASLNELYVQQQAAKDEKKSLGVYMQEGMDRLGGVKAAADAYDAENGYAPGSSWGKLLLRITTGDSKNPDYYVDKALWDQLEADFSGTTEDGKSFGPIPGADSNLRAYIVWALRQPEDKRDPMVWAAEKGLKDEFQKAAEQGVTTNDLGQAVLKEIEPVSPEAAANLLAGVSLVRGADGSGEFLSTTPEQTPAPAAPSYQVGGLGAAMYSAANTASQPVMMLRPLMPLTVIEEQGDWVFVENGYGLQGWVRRGYLSSGAATASPTATAAPTYQVGNLGGTLYSSANTSSQPVIVLPPRAALTTIEEKNGWVHVIEAGGLEGWMRLGYLSKIGEPPVAPATLAPAYYPNVPLPLP